MGKTCKKYFSFQTPSHERERVLFSDMYTKIKREVLKLEFRNALVPENFLSMGDYPYYGEKWSSEELLRFKKCKILEHSNV